MVSSGRPEEQPEAGPSSEQVDQGREQATQETSSWTGTPEDQAEAGSSSKRTERSREGVTQETSTLTETASDHAEAGSSNPQERQKVGEIGAVARCLGVWRKVKEFTEEERFESGVGRAQVKTQIELLKFGLDLLVECDDVGEHLLEYSRLKDILEMKMEATAENNTNTTFVSVQNDGDLPKFTGAFGDWQDFVNAFRVKVADKKHFSKEEKFLKLQACLKLEAKAMTEKFSLKDERAYEKAWKRLNDHYNNSYESFKDHMIRWTTAEEVPHGNGDMGRKMIGKMEACLEKLNAAVRPEDMMSHNLAIQALLLMDPVTREQWMLNRLDGHKVPLLEEVTEFYLRKIQTWDDEKKNQRREKEKGVDGVKIKTEGRYEESTRKQENGRKRFYQQTKSGGGDARESLKARKIECFFCQGPHPVVACEAFAKESVRDREKLAREKNLCRICYSTSHSTCGMRCFECKGEHVVAFCPKK